MSFNVSIRSVRSAQKQQIPWKVTRSAAQLDRRDVGFSNRTRSANAFLIRVDGGKESYFKRALDHHLAAKR